MYFLESLKRTFERVTGRGVPSARQAGNRVVRRKPRTFLFRDDGRIPNNPTLPFVLGIARGRARVQFGGAKGEEIEVGAGDVAILPAGTGHQCLMASADFLVVGAYPPAGTYDECRGSAEEHARAKASIARTPLPQKDPVYGVNGPLTRLWQSS